MSSPQSSKPIKPVPVGRAKGGAARAANMTKEQRSESARKAALTKAANAKLPRATHGSNEHPLVIGDIELSCYVLENGERVLSQRGLFDAFGIGSGGSRGDNRIVQMFESKTLKPFASKDLINRLKTPLEFVPAHGGRSALGYPATILADLCEAVLAARKDGELTPGQQDIAAQCEVLVRGFARVGIIALVDEVTGYQADRTKTALAKILEGFIEKELRPWLQTFPSDYYEQLFRLRGLAYEAGSVKRPQYFGVLTNDIVYNRLAPGVLDELKRITPKNDSGNRKHRFFQRLTANLGYPKLREHLGAVIAVMRMSKDYKDFKEKLDNYYPRLDQETITSELDDDGHGL